MTNRPQPSFTLTCDWMRARLRADTVRRDTITALATAWTEDEGGVMAALDRLAEALAGDPSPAERDALVEAVEDAADMDHAAVEIGLDEALRLRNELDEVIASLSRFNPGRAARIVPGQRESGEAA